jgi:hypothetical protein
MGGSTVEKPLLRPHDDTERRLETRRLVCIGRARLLSRDGVTHREFED